MSHAERFAALLAEIEVYERPGEETARAWRKAGRLSEEAAERAVSSYLRAMHAGAQNHLDLDTVPECCLGDVASTVSESAEEHQASTVAVPQPDRTQGDTLVDPAAFLADVVGQRER